MHDLSSIYALLYLGNFFSATIKAMLTAKRAEKIRVRRSALERS